MTPALSTDGPGGTEPSANNLNIHPDGNPQQVAASLLRLFFSPGDVFEVRAPKCRSKPGSDYKPTISGYYTFESIDAASAAISMLDAEGIAPGIYVTMNPVSPALLARANCRLERAAKTATCDADVRRRLRMLIDCDPVRPADVSSTDAELSLAKAKALAIAAWLKERGWPQPLFILSGNGYHLLFRIDLPADDAGLVKKVLEALAARFDDDHVKIDRSVHNAARITKVTGTMARKDDDLRGVVGVEDRPHRRAALVSAPPAPQVVGAQLLETLAAQAPGKTTTTPPASPRLRPQPSTFERFEHSPQAVRDYSRAARGADQRREAERGRHLSPSEQVPR